MTDCIDIRQDNGQYFCQTPKFGIFAKGLEMLKARAKRRADRATFRYLMKLHPDILKDIGVTRGDVIWAASLPMTQNASQELERVARYGAST